MDLIQNVPKFNGHLPPTVLSPLFMIASLQIWLPKILLLLVLAYVSHIKTGRVFSFYLISTVL